jgi:UDP-glucose 4-epimerase
MQHKDSLVARMMRACLDQGPVSIYGDGNQVRDYVYIDDAVQGVLMPLGSDTVGPLTIGSGTSVSVNELHQLVRAITGVALAAPHVAPRPGEMPGVRVRIDRARRLGFEPHTGLREGLAATWEAFRHNGHATTAREGGRPGVSQG